MWMWNNIMKEKIIIMYRKICRNNVILSISIFNNNDNMKKKK